MKVTLALVLFISERCHLRRSSVWLTLTLKVTLTLTCKKNGMLNPTSHPMTYW